jgi:hypothetical protein
MVTEFPAAGHTFDSVISNAFVIILSSLSKKYPNLPLSKVVTLPVFEITSEENKRKNSPLIASMKDIQ